MDARFRRAELKQKVSKAGMSSIQPMPDGLLAGTVLTTAANNGLGYDTCRELAVQGVSKRIILACRNKTRADAAVEQLRKISSGDCTFEVLICDVSDVDSVNAAVASFSGKLDGLVTNAGGIGSDPGDLTAEGVTNIFALNVLGHAVLIEGFIKTGKKADGARIVASGTELSRGVSKLVLPFGEKFSLPEKTADTIAKKIDGTAYNPKALSGIGGMMTAYGDDKAIFTLYMSEMQHQHPQFTFFTISPGMTAGTNITHQGAMPMWMSAMFGVLFPMLSIAGISHPLEKGAERYVAGLTLQGVLGKPEATGKFYASPPGIKCTGLMSDQVAIMPLFDDTQLHAAAFSAVHRFIK